MYNLKDTQNFMHDKALVKRLVDTMELSADIKVIEIGTGKGIITRELAIRGYNVLSIELDEKLYKYSKDELKDFKSVTLIHGDVLSKKIFYEDCYVVSNLPFNITSEIISLTINAESKVLKAYYIIQREAILNYTGEPYSKESFKSLLIKPFYYFKDIYSFEKKDFKPSPRVETALFEITRRKRDLIEMKDDEKYKDFLAYFYGSSKQNIKSTLNKVFSYKQLKINAKTYSYNILSTVSEITFEQFIGIFKYYLIGVSEEKKAIVKGSYKQLRQQQTNINKRKRSYRQEDYD